MCLKTYGKLNLKVYYCLRVISGQGSIELFRKLDVTPKENKNPQKLTNIFYLLSITNCNSQYVIMLTENMLVICLHPLFVTIRFECSFDMWQFSFLAVGGDKKLSNPVDQCSHNRPFLLNVVSSKSSQFVGIALSPATRSN